MGGKASEEFDDDLDFSDGAGDAEELAMEAEPGSKVSGINFATRTRRTWRDVERAREEREMRRLMSASDDWMDDDFDSEPRRFRN